MAKKTLELLTESMFYVLMAFSKGPKCGTEIAEFVEHITRKRVTIGPGTLYTILSKFQEEALLKEVAVEGRKRTYAITEKGISCFHEEVTRLKMLLEDAEKEGGFHNEL